MEPKLKKEGFYSLFFIPEDHRRMKKFRFSERQIRLLVIGSVTMFVFFVFNAVGFWYYRSLYSSLQNDQFKVSEYEQEKKELIGKVATLEKNVAQVEDLAGELAGMVGTERVQLGKGIGPLSRKSFDLTRQARTISEVELDPAIGRLEEKTTNLQDKIKELYQIQKDRLIYVASTPSVWPVKGWVTSDFGVRRSPFSLSRDFHPGLDIAAQWGTPIIAAADGVVTYAGYRGGLGRTVIIDHGFGLTTRYGHTSRLLVHEGQKIRRGMKIALVGNTGHSTGPHLHYEVHVDGVPVDPMKYIIQ